MKMGALTSSLWMWAITTVRDANCAEHRGAIIALLMSNWIIFHRVKVMGEYNERSVLSSCDIDTWRW